MSRTQSKRKEIDTSASDIVERPEKQVKQDKEEGKFIYTAIFVHEAWTNERPKVDSEIRPTRASALQASEHGVLTLFDTEYGMDLFRPDTTVNVTYITGTTEDTEEMDVGDILEMDESRIKCIESNDGELTSIEFKQEADIHMFLRVARIMKNVTLVDFDYFTTLGALERRWICNKMLRALPDARAFIQVNEVVPVKELTPEVCTYVKTIRAPAHHQFKVINHKAAGGPRELVVRDDDDETTDSETETDM